MTIFDIAWIWQRWVIYLKILEFLSKQEKSQILLSNVWQLCITRERMNSALSAQGSGNVKVLEETIETEKQ